MGEGGKPKMLKHPMGRDDWYKSTEKGRHGRWCCVY